jgi:GDPmannose 4,6-dehydratase
LKRALITGITGQDGAYLVRFLLGKGYSVHGAVRRKASGSSRANLEFLGISDSINLHYADITDPWWLIGVLLSAANAAVFLLNSFIFLLLDSDFVRSTKNAIARGEPRAIAARASAFRHG